MIPVYEERLLVGEAVAVEEADNSRSGKIDLLLKHSVGRKHLHQYLCGIMGLGVAEGDGGRSLFQRSDMSKSCRYRLGCSPC